MANQTRNFTKRDAINSKNGLSMKDHAGATLVTNKIGIVDKHTDAGGDQIGIVITTDGEVYTTISATAIDTLNDCIDLLETEAGEGEELHPISITIQVRTSKNNRDFINLMVE